MSRRDKCGDKLEFKSEEEEVGDVDSTIGSHRDPNDLSESFVSKFEISVVYEVVEEKDEFLRVYEFGISLLAIDEFDP